MTTLDVSRRASDATLQPRPSLRAVPGQAFVRGWGVFALPFDSGHVLALRVFPDSDSGPYRSLWHRDPSGSWSLYVDGPHLQTACPRYFGAGAKETGFATIDVEWIGPVSFRVSVARPSLDWVVNVSTTPILQSLNAVSGRMPLWTFQPAPFMRARELMARALGMGAMRLTGTTPSGHRNVLMPQLMYFIDESTATLNGLDLGRPTRVRPNPKIGDVSLPARGVLVIGQARWDDPLATSSFGGGRS